MRLFAPLDASGTATGLIRDVRGVAWSVSGSGEGREGQQCASHSAFEKMFITLRTLALAPVRRQL